MGAVGHAGAVGVVYELHDRVGFSNQNRRQPRCQPFLVVMKT